MITGGDIEYEPDKPKLYRLDTTDKIVTLIAGDVSAQSSIGQAASLVVVTQGITDIKSAAQAVANAYADYRRTTAERKYLYPLGLTLNDFAIKSGTMSATLVSDIRNQLEHHEIGCEIIVAGVEPSGAAHLYLVVEPGIALCQDITGFVTIGSGGAQAASEFMFHRHHPDAEPWETLILSYTAKRRAEAAPGVGKHTDIAMLAPVAQFFLQPSDIAGLKTIYEKIQTDGEGNWREAKDAIAKLFTRPGTQPPQTAAPNQTGVRAPGSESGSA